MVVSVNRLRRLKPRVALVLNADKKRVSPLCILDLMDPAYLGPGRELEIRRVLPPGAFGINPVEFLPLAV